MKRNVSTAVISIRQKTNRTWQIAGCKCTFPQNFDPLWVHTFLSQNTRGFFAVMVKLIPICWPVTQTPRPAACCVQLFKNACGVYCPGMCSLSYFINCDFPYNTYTDNSCRAHLIISDNECVHTLRKLKGLFDRGFDSYHGQANFSFRFKD
jgi:hypothetical protein